MKTTLKIGGGTMKKILNIKRERRGYGVK